MRKLIRFLLTIIGWPMEREYKMRIANTNFLKQHMPVIAVNGGKIEKGDQVQAYVKAGPGPKRWLEGLVIDVSGDMVQVGIPGQKSGVLVRKGLVKKLRAMKGSVYPKKIKRHEQAV